MMVIGRGRQGAAQMGRILEVYPIGEEKSLQTCLRIYRMARTVIRLDFKLVTEMIPAAKPGSYDCYDYPF